MNWLYSSTNPVYLYSKHKLVTYEPTNMHQYIWLQRYVQHETDYTSTWLESSTMLESNCMFESKYGYEHDE